LQRKKDELVNKWDLLTEKLSRLERERILATDPGVKFRLEKEIDDIKTERHQVEEELNKVEAELHRDISTTPTETKERQETAVVEESARKKQQEAGENVEAAQRPDEEKRLGQEFEFNVVTVNARGEITHRKKHKARQQIEDLGHGVLLEMVYIPGGTFLMGSPENEEGHRNNESPQHQVTIAPFYMGKFPITQAQWEAVMGTNPSHFTEAKRPVEMVSWEETIKFCDQLSLKTGHVYCLPSEAEWEYACRAGTTTPFYFGETITTDLANYDGEEPRALRSKGIFRKETTDVGSFPPNAFGLYDMHGNVWEWCQDWHNSKYYANSPSENPRGPEKGTERVVRGGSWEDDARFCRAASRRYAGGPGARFYDLGFRLVRHLRNP
jgi:formylglycine-generating enzyme required for sulfatase activity